MIPELKYNALIHDSQVFKTKIHDSYMFCNYDSWFCFTPDTFDFSARIGEN